MKTTDYDIKLKTKTIYHLKFLLLLMMVQTEKVEVKRNLM